MNQSLLRQTCFCTVMKGSRFLNKKQDLGKDREFENNYKDINPNDLALKEEIENPCKV